MNIIAMIKYNLLITELFIITIKIIHHSMGIYTMIQLISEFALYFGND